MRNVRTAVVVVIGLAAVAVGFTVSNKMGELQDQRTVAANPIDLRCRSIRVRTSDGVAHRVAFSLTNKSAKAIDWIEVMYRTDVSGAYHEQFKKLPPHAAQTRSETVTWTKYDPGSVKCEDYIVVYSDGSEWRAP